jgi:hypothetical protein
MRGWRSPVDGGPITTIVRFMERRRRARALASRWVSRGTGAHEEAQSSTSPRLTLPHRRRVLAVLTRRSALLGAAGARSRCLSKGAHSNTARCASAAGDARRAPCRHDAARRRGARTATHAQPQIRVLHLGASGGASHTMPGGSAERRKYLECDELLYRRRMYALRGATSGSQLCWVPAVTWHSNEWGTPRARSASVPGGPRGLCKVQRVPGCACGSARLFELGTAVRGVERGRRTLRREVGWLPRWARSTHAPGGSSKVRASALRRGSAGSARLCAAWGGAGTHSGDRLVCVHGLWRRARCCAGLARSWEVGMAGSGGRGAFWRLGNQHAQRDHELGQWLTAHSRLQVFRAARESCGTCLWQPCTVTR